MSDFAAATIAWGGNTITLLDLLKQELGITDNTQDDQLSMYLQMAGEACERYIDNKIDSDQVIENYSHNKTPVALRYYPAAAPVTVEVEGEDVSDDWGLYTDNGIVWITTTACGAERNSCFEQLKITYQAGYDPLPSDLGYAVVRAAAAYETQGGGTSGQVKKESVVGVGSIEYATDADAPGSAGMLSATVIGTLDLYRRVYS